MVARFLRAKWVAAALAAALAFCGPGAWAVPGWGERAVERGIAHFRAGDYGRALVDLSVAARAPGADPAVHLYLGYSLYKLDRFEEASAEVRRALGADPSLDGPLPRFYLGLSLHRRRLYLTSREELVRVVEISGPSRLAAQATEFLRAIDLAVAKAFPDTAHAYHAMGLRALAAERPGAAADAFEEVLRWLARTPLEAAPREDRRREATMYLVGSLCLAGRCDEAGRRLATDPARRLSARLRFARAMVLAGSRQLEAARKLLMRIRGTGSPRLREAAAAFLRALEGR
jgi:tetratricopeptide (TPR) repeat protein